MAKLSNDELLDAFKEMTLIELSEFVKLFEDTFDVKAAAPVAVAGPAGPAAAAEEAAEQDEFDVILEGAGEKKIQVIKVVRELTSLGRRRPRTWSTALRSRCWRRSTRRPRRRPRPLWKRPAPASRSSRTHSASRLTRAASKGPRGYPGGLFCKA